MYLPLISQSWYWKIIEPRSIIDEWGAHLLSVNLLCHSVALNSAPGLIFLVAVSSAMMAVTSGTGHEGSDLGKISLRWAEKYRLDSRQEQEQSSWRCGYRQLHWRSALSFLGQNIYSRCWPAHGQCQQRLRRRSNGPVTFTDGATDEMLSPVTGFFFVMRRMVQCWCWPGQSCPCLLHLRILRDI